MHALAKHLDAFLAETDVAPGSKRTYRRNLQIFLGWADSQGCDSYLVYRDLVAFKESLRDRGITANTCANYLSTVKSFFLWLSRCGLHQNIAAHLKTFRGPKSGKRKDALELESVQKLLRAIPRDTPEGLRDFALLNLLVRAGLRSIEATRLTWGDIQAQNGTYVLWLQGKGRTAKDEWVVLTAESMEPMMHWKNNYPTPTSGKLTAGSPLFCSLSNRNFGGPMTTRSIRRIVKQYLRDIDLDSPRLSCHSLRHTAITLALQGGAPIRSVQKMARHKSVTTTEIYAHDLERLQNPAEEYVELALQKAS